MVSAVLRIAASGPCARTMGQAPWSSGPPTAAANPDETWKACVSDDIVMHPQVLDQVAEGDMIATRLRSGALTSDGDWRLGHRLAREAAIMVLTDDNLAASR